MIFCQNATLLSSHLLSLKGPFNVTESVTPGGVEFCQLSMKKHIGTMQNDLWNDQQHYIDNGDLSGMRVTYEPQSYSMGYGLQLR